jgi:type VI secretion system protein ImpB
MSINDKLDKVRKPRIHIKYEVETENGQTQKELPFVVGVLGDFAGNNPGQEQKVLTERKFTSIDPDNFDDVMHQIKPGVKMRVDNTLKNNGSEISVNLNFNSLSDFEPAQIIKQVPALQELKNTRDKLRDLLSKTDRSDKLESVLEELFNDNEKMQALAKQLGIQQPNQNDS